LKPFDSSKISIEKDCSFFKGNDAPADIYGIENSLLWATSKAIDEYNRSIETVKSWKLKEPYGKRAAVERPRETLTENLAKPKFES